MQGIISIKGLRTVHTSVVRLDVSRLYFAILNDQGITLATVIAKDCGAIEGEVEVLGELAGRIAEEADLELWAQLLLWIAIE